MKYRNKNVFFSFNKKKLLLLFQIVHPVAVAQHVVQAAPVVSQPVVHAAPVIAQPVVQAAPVVQKVVSYPSLGSYGSYGSYGHGW